MQKNVQMLPQLKDTKLNESMFIRGDRGSSSLKAKKISESEEIHNWKDYTNTPEYFAEFKIDASDPKFSDNLVLAVWSEENPIWEIDAFLSEDYPDRYSLGEHGSLIHVKQK